MESKHIFLSILGVLLFSGLSFALSCGDTITTNTTMTEDLTGCANGLIIGADNVVLDCDGHKIYGVDALSSKGIAVTGRSGVAIRNCDVSDFIYGIYVENSDGITISNNTAHYNSDGYFLYKSSGNTLTGNTAYDNSYGFLLENSSSNTLSDNNASLNSFYGIYLLKGSSYNTLTGNKANKQKNVGVNRGFYVASSPHNSFSGNEAHGNKIGIEVINSSDTSLSGDHLYDNDWYNNDYYDLYLNGFVGTVPCPTSIVMENVVFDRDAGDYTNYTILSLTDQLINETYTVDWSVPVPLPPDPSYSSFAGKFVNMSGKASPIIIDSIVWHWLDSESAGYDESKFELWKHNASGWSNTCAVRNKAANTLSLSNFKLDYHRSVYGIIYNDLALNCGGTITANTTMACDLTGCGADGLKIMADNVVLDCDGHKITGIGGFNTRGIYVYGDNVTIRNCDISRFGYGIEIQDSVSTELSSNTVHDNLFNGVRVRGISNLTTITDDHYYNNTRDFEFAGTGVTMGLDNIIFDNAAGNLQDYTALSLSDVNTGATYYIDWTAGPAPLPSGYNPFAQKFVDITATSGVVSIDSITWHWLDSESAGYVESMFELWKYNASGWTDTGATLDTAANTLSLSNLEPGSVYGILYKIPIDYGTIHAVVTSTTGGGGQEPMPNAPVLAYDKTGCAAVYIPKSNELVADTSCQPDASCTTDADGVCDMHVPAGDYFVLVKVPDNSGKYPGHTVADVMPGETKLARLAFKVGSDWVWIVLAVLAILGGGAFLYSRRSKA